MSLTLMATPLKMPLVPTDSDPIRVKQMVMHPEYLSSRTMIKVTFERNYGANAGDPLVSIDFGSLKGDLRNPVQCAKDCESQALTVPTITADTQLSSLGDKYAAWEKTYDNHPIGESTKEYFFYQLKRAYIGDSASNVKKIVSSIDDVMKKNSEINILLLKIVLNLRSPGGPAIDPAKSLSAIVMKDKTYGKSVTIGNATIGSYYTSAVGAQVSSALNAELKNRSAKILQDLDNSSAAQLNDLVIKALGGM